MTSSAQRIMLFSLFAKLAKARGWVGQTQREIEREKITLALFGDPPPSWSDLTNAEIDRLKARLESMRDDSDLGAQIADANASDDGERRRLIHRIESDAKQAGFGDGYMRSIIRDQADTSADWRDLPLGELENLRDTIANRARRKAFARKAAGNGSAETQRRRGACRPEPQCTNEPF